jgi:hypothetical protein
MSKLGSSDSPVKPNYERLYNSRAIGIPFLPSVISGVSSELPKQPLWPVPTADSTVGPKSNFALKRACVHCDEARCDARSQWRSVSGPVDEMHLS